MIKVLHLADLHFRSRWLELMVECFPAIMEAAEQVDLVLVTGDTYEGPMPLDSEPVRTCREFYSQLSSIAPVLVIRGTYTHDRNQLYYLSDINSPQIMVVDQPGVALFRHQSLTWCGEVVRPMTKEELKADDEEVLVIGCLPEPPKVLELDHANGLIQAICSGYRAATPEGVPLVIAGHMGVSGSDLSNQSILGQYVGRSVLESGGCPVFLGHIHKPQQIGSRIFYSGSPWPLNYGEAHQHGFYIHRLVEGGAIFSTFVERTQRKVIPITIDRRVENTMDLDGILKSCADKFKDNLVFLKIWPGKNDPSRLRANAEAILQKIAPHDFKIEMLREDEINVRSQEIATAQTLRQKILVIRPEASESVLKKADFLEQENPEKLENEVREL